MQENSKFERKLPHQEIDYFKLGKILLSRWYWIAVTVVICMVYAKVYLWITPKTYSTSATLKFEDKKSELSELNGNLPSTSNNTARIQSEIYVMQSSPLLLRAIKSIDYKVSYYLPGRVRTSDLYPEKPFDVQFISVDSLNLFSRQLTLKPIDAKTFNLSYKEGKKTIQKDYNYNSPITLGSTSFSINYHGGSPVATYLFNFNTADSFLGRVKGGFRTGEVTKNSNILPLQEIDQNPVFAADILNAIMSEYLDYDREQKTKSASQIISFINKQLEFLSRRVKGAEDSLQRYKQNNRIIDVGTASQTILNKSSALETQRAALQLQLSAIDDFKDKLIKEKDAGNINFNLSGTLDPLLSSLINQYNGLLNQKSAALKLYNEKSQPIAEINREILRVKNAALGNVNNARENIQRNIDLINNQSKGVSQQIAMMPIAERDLLTLQRNFDINEKVYSFLNEKRLDAQISSSAILPGASIVDHALPNFGPIAPDEHDINRTAIIIGLLSGLGIIVLIRILNPYIYDKETVESLTTVPIIGVIRKFPVSLDEDNSQLLALSKPRSIFAESVRSVRTNLNFLASDKASKVICITSEVAGEGKSFVAVNLSSTLALINKKAILIGADLRRSRIHKTFRVPNDMGLSNYLANQATLKDIVNSSEVENLDFIVSGPVPPNPSELLHSQRMRDLVEELKGLYDIIVIDTAPVGLVSDSIPLIRISDINVFVIRSGKSKFYSATIPQRIAAEYGLDNTVIVLNAFEEDLLHSRYYTTKFTGDGYGSRYYYYSDYSGYASSGYYVDDDEKKWWHIKRWIKF